MIDHKQILKILEKIRKVKIAVYGDFCLDAYWLMDPEGSEISVETGLKAEAVRKQYYSPGGASNVVANLAALHPAGIRVIGVTGNDIFGRELRVKLQQLHVDTSFLFLQEDQFDTCTFVKKYDREDEQPRIDFGLYNLRSEKTDQQILEQMETALLTYDILIINQQVPGSITRPEFIDDLNRIIKKYSHKLIILDSRHYNDQFRNVCLKTNYIEIARMNGVSVGPDEHIPLKRIETFGSKVFRSWGKPVFVTCGERGILTFDESGTHLIQGIQLLKKLDPVGAGDTTLSALALCLAAGYSPKIAAEFANLAATVTVQKLFITGTASGEEILEAGRDPDYIYHPDLADATDGELMLPGTRIEICEEGILEISYPLKHVVFDHDGTLSTLRAGWEQVMEDCMIRVIAGRNQKVENSRICSRIKERVKEYIEKSTGLPTLMQMKTLVELVEEFNMVPVEERLDEFAYKRLYLKELMKVVEMRLKKLESGEMSREQFMIPGILTFLESLKASGIVLHLASGTDEPDVKKEARVLGYANLFGNNIFGARDNLKDYSKKTLIDRIMKENRLKGNELMVVGDGPVEIRECRKKEGLAVGMATHEDGSQEVNQEKRRRLILAGAQIILPDYRDGKHLLKRILP
jgi:rfaE bifunctional protein kinase chain/domain